MEISNEHRLTEVEERSKSNQHRIDELEKRQNNLEELTGTVKVLAIKEENVENTVNEIKDDVKSLKNIPAKNWNGLVEKGISALVGGIIGFILFKLGIGM